MPRRCRAGTAEVVASLFQLQRRHFGLSVVSSGCLVLPTHAPQPQRWFLLGLSFAIAPPQIHVCIQIRPHRIARGGEGRTANAADSFRGSVVFLSCPQGTGDSGNAWERDLQN